MNRDYLTQQLMATRRELYNMGGQIAGLRTAVRCYQLLALAGWVFAVALIVVSK